MCTKMEAVWVFINIVQPESHAETTLYEYQGNSKERKTIIITLKITSILTLKGSRDLSDKNYKTSFW